MPFNLKKKKGFLWEEFIGEGSGEGPCRCLKLKALKVSRGTSGRDQSSELITF